MGRLIDADALYSEIGSITPVDIHDLAYQTLKAIKNAPTAYDVEKIVERLRGKAFDYRFSEGEMVDLSDAIEIVRKGGVE